MNKYKIAINGFGRIGRTFFRQIFKDENFNVVAINDLGDVDNLIYLLRHDTSYGYFDAEIKINDKNEKYTSVNIGGHDVLFFKENIIENLPWRSLDIDVVVESTGKFVSCDKTSGHISAGAKRVVLSAPFADCPDIINEPSTILIGSNDEKFGDNLVTSNGSCTTNALAPIISILDKEIGIDKALINTIHAYTSSQKIVDSVQPANFRVGRAAASNLIPTETGASISLTKVFPNLVNNIDGIAVRVPIITGSIADITFIAKRDTTVDEINGILLNESKKDKWKNIFTVTNEPIVSSDIVGLRFGAIIDQEMTRVVGGNLVKVFSWYDNEAGYVATLIEHVRKSLQYIK